VTENVKDAADNVSISAFTQLRIMIGLLAARRDGTQLILDQLVVEKEGWTNSLSLLASVQLRKLPMLRNPKSMRHSFPRTPAKNRCFFQERWPMLGPIASAKSATGDKLTDAAGAVEESTNQAKGNTTGKARESEKKLK